MNERLAELESQVKQLYEKLGMSTGIETEELQFEEGKWYHIDGMIIKVEKFHGYCNNGGGGIDGYGINLSGDWRPSGTNFGVYTKNKNRPATANEVETALRKEWKRRCEKAGWDNPDEAEIEGHAKNYNGLNQDKLNTGDFIQEYHSGLDRFYNKNGCIYQDGSWATPKEKKSEVNPIVVNGYEAEFHEGYVQFGCAKIENSIFKELQEFIDAERPDVAGTIGNKAVTGFRIGEGFFGIETIKAITERL